MKEEEVIENEEHDLEKCKKELKRLKSKWFKLAKTNRIIKFLEVYCREKEKFIEVLKSKN